MIRLVVILCLGAAHCERPRPITFKSWQACANAGVSMVYTARKVGSGLVMFQCKAMGGTVR